MNASSSMVKTLALSSAESLINKALLFDPITLQGIQTLEGKVLRIQARTPGFELHLIPTEKGIELFSIYDEQNADCTVQGSTFDLIQLLIKKDQGLAGSPVATQGDTALAETLLDLAHELDIDWEEILSGLVGDIAAHEIGRQGRRFGRWTKKVHQSMLRNTREYLHYESRAVVNEKEIQQFGEQIERLDNDLIKLETRIQDFEARLKN